MKIDWRWDARFVDWRSTVDLTPGEADRHARYLKDNGVNAVCVSHHDFTVRKEGNRQLPAGHMLFRQGSINEPVVERALKIICEACHKHGLKVIEHHSSNLIPVSGEYRGSKFVDWSNVDARTGERIVNNPYGYPNLACINNADWRRKYFSYLRRLFENTAPDGLMHDDIQFNAALYNGVMSCGCEYCRRAFHRETGLRLPRDGNSSFWSEHAGRRWRAFVRFRWNSVVDELKCARRVIGRDKLLFTCNSHEYNAKYVHGYGISQNTVITAVDMSFCETMSRATSHELRRLAVSRKVFSGRACSYGRPALMFFYGFSYAEDFLGWALSKAFGLQSMSGSIYDTPDKPDHPMNIYPGSYRALNVNKYFVWEKKHQAVFHRPRPAADIGLLYAIGTIQEYRPGDGAASYIVGGENKYFVDGFQGWCDTLLEHKTSFEVVNDIDLEKGCLSRYRLLILPNAACLSEAAMRNLRRFVDKGGRLLATHHTSLYTPAGERRRNFGLKDLFGVDYRETVSDVRADTFGRGEITGRKLAEYDQIQFLFNTVFSPEQYGCIRDYVRNGGDIYTFDALRPYPGEVVLGHHWQPVEIREKGLVYRYDWSAVKPRDGARLLYTAGTGGREFPWLIHNKYGRGEVMYCAGKPGLMAFTRGFTLANSEAGLPYPERCTRYRLWVDTSDRKWKDWMLELVQTWGVENKPFLMVEKAPPGMIVNTFKTGVGLVVNLLNTGAGQCARGDEMPSSHEVSYPSVKKHCGSFLRLRIRRRIGRAVLISPDLRSPVRVRSSAEGPYTVLHVPADKLKRYAVLVIGP